MRESGIDDRANRARPANPRFSILVPQSFRPLHQERRQQWHGPACRSLLLTRFPRRSGNVEVSPVVLPRESRKEASSGNTARGAPADLETLRALPGLTSATVNAHGEEILQVVRAARDAAPALIWPTPESPTPAQQDLTRRMLDRIKTVATEHTISAGVIATRRSVLELIHDRRGPLTEGWRRELIGAELLALVGPAN